MEKEGLVLVHMVEAGAVSWWMVLVLQEEVLMMARATAEVDTAATRDSQELYSSRCSK